MLGFSPISSAPLASYGLAAGTLVSADFGASYLIESALNIVGSDLSLTYSILEYVGIDLQCAFSLASFIGSDLAASYAISQYGAAIRPIDPSYNVLYIEPEYWKD